MSGFEPFRTCRDAVQQYLPHLSPAQSEDIVQRALAYEYAPLQETVIEWCACARTAGILADFLQALPAGEPVAREYERGPSHTVDALKRALAKLIRDVKDQKELAQQKLQRAFSELYRSGYRDPRHGIP